MSEQKESQKHQKILFEDQNNFQQFLQREQLDGKERDIDYNYQFFKELQNIRKYRQNIQNKMAQLNQKREGIYKKAIYYEKKSEQEFKDYIRGEAPQRKKRNRRNAEQIQRKFQCPTCGKLYGAQGSLNQHIKIKHPSVYQPKKKSSCRDSNSQSYMSNND